MPKGTKHWDAWLPCAHSLDPVLRNPGWVIQSSQFPMLSSISATGNHKNWWSWHSFRKINIKNPKDNIQYQHFSCTLSNAESSKQLFLLHSEGFSPWLSYSDPSETFSPQHKTWPKQGKIILVGKSCLPQVTAVVQKQSAGCSQDGLDTTDSRDCFGSISSEAL